MSLYSKKFKTNTLLSFGAVTIAVYAGMGMLAKPVEAMPIYQDETGQKCSTCHSRSGILDRTYMPLTGHGKYFKANGQLPPPPKPKTNRCPNPRNLKLFDDKGNYVQDWYGCVK